MFGWLASNNIHIHRQFHLDHHHCRKFGNKFQWTLFSIDGSTWSTWSKSSKISLWCKFFVYFCFIRLAFSLIFPIYRLHAQHFCLENFVFYFWNETCMHAIHSCIGNTEQKHALCTVHSQESLLFCSFEGNEEKKKQFKN